MAGFRKNAVYVGLKGHVVALEISTGQELWRTKLKGMDYVTVAVDGARLYAATRGELFALEPHQGKVLWHNRLKGLGLGIVSILTERMASDSNPAAAREAQRRAEAAAAT